MKPIEEKYIRKILSFLKNSLDMTEDEILLWLKLTDGTHVLEGDGYGYQYCLISLPFGGFEHPDLPAERITLLVFEGDTVIADISAIWTPASELIHNEDILDQFEECDPWTRSNLYVMKTAFFVEKDPKPEDIGCIITNAYVTETYRRKGIFTAMVQMIREQAMRFTAHSALLYQVISLDPDVACYGPDTTDEVYYYSMEQDEPKRMINAEIIQKLDFAVVQLEHTEEDSLSDGTFIWYGIKAEHITILRPENPSHSLS